MKIKEAIRDQNGAWIHGEEDIFVSDAGGFFVDGERVYPAGNGWTWSLRNIIPLAGDGYHGFAHRGFFVDDFLAALAGRGHKCIEQCLAARRSPHLPADALHIENLEKHGQYLISCGFDAW